MATHLKRNNTFARRLFFSVGGIFLLLALCFCLYQYNREEQFKIDILDSNLRTYCLEMAQSLNGDSLKNSKALKHYVKNHRIEGLRITIIDLKGNVLFDSSNNKVEPQENHIKRKEISQALKTGKGYDIKRTSTLTHKTYFYSATKIGNLIVRAAVPYSLELTKSLQADNSYLYFSIILTLLLGFVLYINTSRIGRHVRYLQEFALKAEQGEQIDQTLERQLPDDELGDISHRITSLYWKLRESEEDKVRLKRQLTQNAAHELKTPAASIHGYLESIIDNPQMPEEKKQHFISRCYAQSERMSKLLEDMTTLMRLDETSSLTIKRSFEEIVDVKALILSIIDDVLPLLDKNGIKTILNLPEEIKIKADKGLLQSVFQNIIDNVIAYAIGANTLTITCKELENSQNSQSKYEFTISDNGIGVPLEHLPHLFERFYRVDKGRSRQTGGTGLGLSIVKNSILAHGGMVTAEQTLGGGLTIRFTL